MFDNTNGVELSGYKSAGIVHKLSSKLFTSVLNATGTFH